MYFASVKLLLFFASLLTIFLSKTGVSDSGKNFYLKIGKYFIILFFFKLSVRYGVKEVSLQVIKIHLVLIFKKLHYFLILENYFLSWFLALRWLRDFFLNRISDVEHNNIWKKAYQYLISRAWFKTRHFPVNFILFIHT